MTYPTNPQPSTEPQPTDATELAEPTEPVTPADPPRRSVAYFWQRVQHSIDSDGCWNWIGMVNHQQCPKIDTTNKVEGRINQSARIFSLELAGQPRIAGHVPRPNCGNIRCIRPEAGHLEWAPKSKRPAFDCITKPRQSHHQKSNLDPFTPKTTMDVPTFEPDNLGVDTAVNVRERSSFNFDWND